MRPTYVTRYRATKELEETVKELLEKETIFYKGIEYSGLTELAVAHGFDVTMVWDRLKYGFTLDRALTQPIRELNRPELEVEYQGERYPNKSCLLRCFGISSSCIYEMMGNHGVDFETAVDVYRETKERAGIPQEKLISYLNRIEKMLVEQGFKAKRAEEEDIRRILAVYFEQNVTTEKFDGERWIILND